MPTFSNPNLRQSSHDYTSPTEMSVVGTPDSSSTGSHSMQQQYPANQQFGIGNAIPDLNAMMFPSADPFAYPNQPMMEFDNIKRETMDMGTPSQGAAMYLQGNLGEQGIYDNLEGQLFGPLPPYLAQGQQNFEYQAAQIDGSGGSNMMGFLGPQQGGFNPGGAGMIPSNDMNFDGIFTGEGEEWGELMTDQRFK